MCFPLFLKSRNLFILQPGLGYVILVAYRAPEHAGLNESLSSVTGTKLGHLFSLSCYFAAVTFGTVAAPL